MLLVYHSAQLRHTWSDFSCSLRVMISETRSLFHFVLVLLSSTLMKQLTLFLFYVFLVWIFSWRGLFQVTGTDANCVLYIICSQFITFEQVALFSAYCAWFIALFASSYTVLLCSCPCLFLSQFDSSVHIRILLELR